MTGENIRANVADAMRLARSALRAADALLGLGLVPDAASPRPEREGDRLEGRDERVRRARS